MTDNGKKIARSIQALCSLLDYASQPPAPPMDLDGAPPFKIPETGRTCVWRSINGGVQARIDFPNGYEASVVRHRFSYGVKDGQWELAVCLADDGPIVYDTPITDDVIGHLSEEAVTDLLFRISALPKRGDALKAPTDSMSVHDPSTDDRIE